MNHEYPFLNNTIHHNKGTTNPYLNLFSLVQVKSIKNSKLRYWLGGNNNEPLDKHAAIMLLHELLGKPQYSPPGKKEKNLSEIKASKSAPEKMDTEVALNRARRHLRRETIKQELSAELEKNEKPSLCR